MTSNDLLQATITQSDVSFCFSGSVNEQSKFSKPLNNYKFWNNFNVYKYYKSTLLH